MKRKSRYLAYAALALVAVAVAFSAVSGAQVDGTQTPQIGDDGEASNATANETLERVTGTLEEVETGEGDYRLGGTTVEIGARWYVEENEAPADFDGDGTVETIAEEFDGMVGQEVTLTVESDDDDDVEAGDVHAVGGVSYRGDGPPPWAGGPNRDGKNERRGGNSHGPPPWAGEPDGDVGDSGEETDEKDDRNGGNGPPPWAGGPSKDRKDERKGGNGPPPWAGGPNK